MKPIRGGLLSGVVALVLLALFLPGFALAGIQKTKLISVNSKGEQGPGSSLVPAISANGRFVAFYSVETDLVPNFFAGVLIRDRKAKTTRRVSPRSPGYGDHPSISADGRYVAFEADDDVWVRDMETGRTKRVNIGAPTSPAIWASSPSISADGRYAAFESGPTSDPTGVCRQRYTRQVLVRDRKRRKTTCASVNSDGRPVHYGGDDPAISANGRFVAFSSDASRLVANDTNEAKDIFVRDRRRHTTRRVNVSSEGEQATNPRGRGFAFSYAPAISADGRFVAFQSEASNLVPRDTNERMDIFIRDRRRHRTTRVSLASDGRQAPAESFSPSISGDGRYVAFTSHGDLVGNDTNGRSDVFVRDRKRHVTSLISVGVSGGLGNDHSGWPSISSDGHWVAFESGASNLVPGDTTQCFDEDGDQDNCYDVFVRGPLP